MSMDEMASSVSSWMVILVISGKSSAVIVTSFGKNSFCALLSLVFKAIEILTAFVRINSPVEDEDLTTIEEGQPQNKVSLDTQAVLTIIGRRNYSLFMGESKMINLSGINLQEAFLNVGNLGGVCFEKSFGRRNDSAWIPGFK